MTVFSFFFQHHHNRFAKRCKALLKILVSLFSAVERLAPMLQAQKNPDAASRRTGFETRYEL